MQGAQPSPALRSGLAALGLFAIALSVYTWRTQARFFGDGAGMVDEFLFGGGLWMHVLYLPAARLLRVMLDPEDPIDALRWVSSLGGAVGVASIYLLARALAASPGRALFAATLAGLTPAIWFFSTTVEVHALHFGTVALCALLTVHAPWNRPALALVLTLVLTPLIYLTHKSGLLLAPGWFAWVLLARERSAGKGFGRGSSLLVGAGLAVVFLATVLLAARLKPEQNRVSDTLDFILLLRSSWSLHFLEEAVVIGLGFLVPLALLGLPRTSRRESIVLGSLVLPLFVFFWWFGEPTRGGYFAGIVPFLALLALRGLPAGRAAIPVAAVVLSLQGWIAWHQTAAFERSVSNSESRARASAVRDAIGERGLLVSLEPTHQPITLALSGVREINVLTTLLEAAGERRTPAEVGEMMMGLLRTLAAQNEGPIALDLGLQRSLNPAWGLEAYLRAIEARASQDFGPARRTDPRFPMIVVR